MEPEWVLFSLGFSEDPDPMVATFVVGTAIAEDIIEALQARFPKLQHSRRSWGEYSPNERNALVQMVCDARQGALPEPQRALVGSAHEMLERRVEELDRAYHGGILTPRHHAGAVIEMRRLLDAGEPLEAVKGETESSMDCVSNHRKGAIVKPKRSTESGEGRVKLIAALTLHHRYADGSCLNLEPIGNNELARKAEVSGATASGFFKNEFKGYNGYRIACRDATRLVGSLKLLNQEFSPHHLFGDKPPGEHEDK